MKKRKKLRLQVVSKDALPYEKMWGDLVDTLLIIWKKNEKEDGTKVIGAVLAIIDSIKERYEK